MSEVMPSNNFSGKRLPTREDWERLEDIASWVYEMSRWHAAFVGAIQKGDEPVPTSSPFALARITQVNGSGNNATYSAESIAGPSLSVENATPDNRMFGIADIFEMEVGDKCMLYLDDDNEVKLVQFKEEAAFGSCAVQPGGVGLATAGGAISIAQQQSGLTLGQLIDYLMGKVTQIPAGSDTYVQYNNAGEVGASSKFTFNNTTGKVTLSSGDLAFQTNTTGPVLKDRSDGREYRLYTDGGVLFLES